MQLDNGVLKVSTLQNGAQYGQKASPFSPNKAQVTIEQEVDDIGADASKRGKRFFPFSDGPRNCVGQSLAKMSMAATMAQLYSNFSFKLAEEVNAMAVSTARSLCC